MATDTPQLSNASRVIAALPLVLVAIGRFVPGPAGWGFNHFAYLPAELFWGWIIAAAAMVFPPTQRAVTDFLLALADRRKSSAVLVLLSCLGLAIGFWALREATYLIGDGYLITEMVERGDRFRTYDNMDYFLHAAVYRALKTLGSSITAGQLYQTGSVAAGVVATLLAIKLTANFPWSPSRKALLLVLFVLGPQAQLFFGHVESYTWMYVAFSGFLIASVAVLSGWAPLWLASTLFGLALFFHLTAVFGFPALLFLTWRAPIPRARRWMQATVIPALFLVASALAHVAAGYGFSDFRQDFIGSGIAIGMWIGPSDHSNLSSPVHWKDQLNLALLLSAASTAFVLLRGRALVHAVRQTPVQFLLVQIVSLIFFSILTDRRLGAARDWDLLAGQSFGMSLLAVVCIPPAGGERDRLIPLAAVVSVLVALPWFVLQHIETASITRYVDVARDYPPYARAYAYEEVGKYFRNRGEIDRALRMFERSVETLPSNSRFQMQLGALHLSKAETDSLSRQRSVNHLQEAVRLDPDNVAAMTLLAPLSYQSGEIANAAALYRRLSMLEPSNLQHLEGLGYSEMDSGNLAEAERAFRQVLSQDPNYPVRKALGSVLLGQERYPEAATLFEEAIKRGDPDIDLEYGLAASRVYEIEQSVRGGTTPNAALVASAVSTVRKLVQTNPDDPTARSLADQLQRLLLAHE